MTAKCGPPPTHVDVGEALVMAYPAREDTLRPHKVRYHPPHGQRVELAPIPRRSGGPVWEEAVRDDVCRLSLQMLRGLGTWRTK